MLACPVWPVPIGAASAQSSRDQTVSSRAERCSLSVMGSSEGLAEDFGRLERQPQTSQLDSVSASQGVVRPIQYLGSKLRSTPFILDAVSEVAPKGSRILDAFAGTSVVGQALARSGFLVTAIDSLGFSASMARAMLGVGRAPNQESGTAEDLWEQVADSTWAARGFVEDAFSPWLVAESSALNAGEPSMLLRLATEIPQVWRPETSRKRLRSLLADVASRTGHDSFPLGALASTHYAGTYFGLAQAIEIDALRWKIEHHVRTRRISAWQSDVLLTGLFSAMSSAVFSPGKHFAQYHNVLSGKNTAFLRRRLQSDRSISIIEAARQATLAVHEAAQDGGRHQVLHSDIGRVPRSLLESTGVRVFYADPPYTSQQYSRFYHVPEVIWKYKVPRLQWRKGRPTKGLYPVPSDRHQSLYSSKRRAGAAIQRLMKSAVEVGASLVLSYSGTEAPVSGNARMIALDDLVEYCQVAFGKQSVDVRPLDFSYRQFNKSDSAVPGRNDLEFLIVARAD